MAEYTSTPDPSDNIERSSLRRTVCLFDWWLVKAENDFRGKRLAVTGVSSRKEDAVRLFVSAPIAKRFDFFSLETADGVSIVIKGFINEERTLENGFTPEVFNHFTFGFPPNWENLTADFFKEESVTGIDSASAVIENLSAVDPELTDGLEKSIRISLVSPEEVSGDQEIPFPEDETIVCEEKSIPTLTVSPEQASLEQERPLPEDECNASKEMGGVNAAHGSGRNRCSSRLHDINVCQQKKNPASGGPPNHSDKSQSSTTGTLEHPDVVLPGSPFTPIQSRSLEKVNTSSEQLIKESVSRKSIPTLLVSPEQASQEQERPLPEDECNASKEMGGVNAAHGSGRNRHSSRLHDINVCQKKNRASGGPPKQPETLEHPDGVGLGSPLTPIQPISLGKVNTSSELLVKKSVYRFFRKSSANTEGYSKRKRLTVEKKVISPKRKRTESASAVKNLQEKDVTPLNKGDREKISSVTPESLSLRKSRSGRLLLPPLEFWRNQIPVYNADHEITEIKEGASLVSPCNDSSPSVRRFKNHKRAA